MRHTEEELRKIIADGLEARKIITLKTYYLSDYGEMALKVVARSILERYNRLDLMDIVYTSAKELIINATKANFKRLFFEERGIDAQADSDYEEGIQAFKRELVEQKIRQYRARFVELGYPVVATFYYSPQVLNIKVKNNFRLYPQEEDRIREKFDQARAYSNLFDFYMKHGDETEGAGLGLTMVGILLDQSGIDRHLFTLSTNRYNETAARLEIPLDTQYKTRRELFEEEMRRRGMSADELRKVYKPPFSVLEN